MTYRTTFTLPVNTNLSSVKIVGSWAMDDKALDILINGNSTGISQSVGTYSSFHSFTLPVTFYQIGQNTLDFKWMNGVAVGGLNVYFTQASYTISAATVSGRLKMQGIVGYGDNQSVTFAARSVSGGSSITQVLSVSPSGIFSMTGLGYGPYTLHIKGDKYLAVNVSVNTTGGSVSGVTATLPAGDANNDNSVDTSDFNVLVGAFGSDSSMAGSGYDTTADFNSDGLVDTTDFNLLVGNFGEIGAQ